MKKTIQLTESELHSMIASSVRKILSEGVIPNEEIQNGVIDYVTQKLNNGETDFIVKWNPELINVISDWLTHNGDPDFIKMICHNFLDPRKY